MKQFYLSKKHITLIIAHICSGDDGCCNRVLVKATGGAKDDQSLYLGSYKKVSSPYNGRGAYQREGTDKLYIYFFTSEVILRQVKVT